MPNLDVVFSLIYSKNRQKRWHLQLPGKYLQTEAPGRNQSYSSSNPKAKNPGIKRWATGIKRWQKVADFPI